VTNSKFFDDFNFDGINFNKHKITILKGAVMYRFCHKGSDPLKPTGKASRFASEPGGYTFEGYSQAFDKGVTNAILVGTGSTYFCETIPTACLEVGSTQKKDLYKITLKKDIELINIDSICESIGVDKPYITEERHPFFHKFYGIKKVNGVYLESAKNPIHHNYVIFLDKFPEFRNIVEKEKMSLNSKDK
jgi:hypothetical protein